MLYTELLKLWDESVQAIDAKDWQGALAKLEQITEPTSRTLFNAAAAHLALGQQDEALKALDFAIAKDDRLAVGFFQRAAVMIQVNRLEEALSDCIWAQKHMRGNMVIDYKQLGLRHKLFSWQVLYNAAAVYCRMNQWEQATEVLLSAMQEKGGGRGGVNIEATLERRKEFLEPLMVPVDAVFRPRKQDVEQLEKRDFLGKAKVRVLCRHHLLSGVLNPWVKAQNWGHKNEKKKKKKLQKRYKCGHLKHLFMFSNFNVLETSTKGR
uniref:NADPH oxidase activator 1 n=1 Tax=Gouania willdenowi TaxID=441366 RepID=A0A8C5NBW4_GOUWI